MGLPGRHSPSATVRPTSAEEKAVHTQGKHPSTLGGECKDTHTDKGRTGWEKGDLEQQASSKAGGQTTPSGSILRTQPG